MNLHYLFYHDYYKGIANILGRGDREQEAYFMTINESLLNVQINCLNYRYPATEFHDLKSVNLKTVYPGLLIGSGYNHESHRKGEFKLGFFFDHTSGQPVIPASSIKGVLRSTFPSFLSDPKKRNKDSRATYILKHITGKDEPNQNFLNLIEAEIFDGKNPAYALASPEERKKHNIPEYLSVYKRDIFFDAWITAGGKDNKIFSDDYITPHKHKDNPELDPFVEPVPIKFLRILPGVQFTFYFKLTNSTLPKADGTIITADDKLRLFKRIILDIGVGAKTNVGYGQFCKISHDEQSAKNQHTSAKPQKKSDSNPIPIECASSLKKGKIFKGEVTEVTENELFITFEVDNKTCKTRKKKHDKTKDLKAGDSVIITINADWNGKEDIQIQIRKNT